MTFLLIRVLLHKAHEEDKEYRCGGDANDNGEDHNSSS